MASEPLLLLPAKTSQPRPVTPLLSRPRLAVLPRSHEKLIVLTAPAGSGKTSALLDALQHHPIRCCWYSLDTSDNQPLQFATYVLQSLQPCLTAPIDLQAEQASSAARLFSLLLQQLQQVPQTDCLLVLDDWHYINNPEVQQLLGQLLQHSPDWLKLLLTSRVQPEWPFLASWQLRGWVRTLDYGQLALTDQEAIDFCQQRRPNWHSPVIRQLNQQLEGWALGLQALVLNESNLSQVAVLPQRQFSDYLLQELLAQQTPELQQFLLNSCVLERFNLELLQQVTQLPHCRELLAQVQQRQLFLVALDQQQQWYRYHHLFAETLRQQLQQQTPHLWLQYQARCARAWQQQRHAVAALTHALLAEDMALLLDILLDFGWTLQRTGHQQLLEAGCHQVGDALLLQHPDLCLLYAWHLSLNQRQHQSARVLLRQLRAQIPAEHWPKYRYEVVNLECHIGFDLCEHAQVQQLIEQELLGELPDFSQAANPASYLGLYAVLAEYQLNLGQLDAAADYYQRELRLQQPYQQSLPLWCYHQLGLIHLLQGQVLSAEQHWLAVRERSENNLDRNFNSWCVHLALAELYIDQNQLQAAEHQCQQALAHCPTSSSHPWLLAPYCLQLRLSQLQQPAANTDHLWQRCQQNCHQYQHHPVTLARMDALQLRLWQQQPQPSAIQTWLSQNPLNAHQPVIAQQQLGRNRAYAWLLLQQPERAVAELQPQQQQAYDAGMWREVGKNQLWLSFAYQTLNLSQSLTQLAELLTQAEAWALSGYLLEHKTWLYPLLPQLAAAALSSAALALRERLLALMKPRSLNRRGQQLPGLIQAIPLTHQEWLVLQRIGQQQTNEQIASELFISLATVKSHINRLYRKLQLEHREQAQAKAQQLMQHLAETASN